MRHAGLLVRPIISPAEAAADWLRRIGESGDYIVNPAAPYQFGVWHAAARRVTDFGIGKVSYRSRPHQLAIASTNAGPSFSTLLTAFATGHEVMRSGGYGLSIA